MGLSRGKSIWLCLSVFNSKTCNWAFYKTKLLTQKRRRNSDNSIENSSAPREHQRLDSDTSLNLSVAASMSLSSMPKPTQVIPIQSQLQPSIRVLEQPNAGELVLVLCAPFPFSRVCVTFYPHNSNTTTWRELLDQSGDTKSHVIFYNTIVQSKPINGGNFSSKISGLNTIGLERESYVVVCRIGKFTTLAVWVKT